MIGMIHLSLLLLSSYILYSQQIKPRSIYAVRTESRPKTSCQLLYNVPSKTKCFFSCLNALDVYYMFSYNKNHSCLCCKDLSGNDITDMTWKTYLPRPCQDGYVTYNYTDFQICLKYVSDLVRYSQARARCEAEGGDLIRIDSDKKYTIFKEMLRPLSNPPDIQVWIQAVKVGQIWRFHDGALLPDFAKIDMTNEINETHARARSVDSFSFHDAPDGDNFNYMCEYYRQFLKRVHV